MNHSKLFLRLLQEVGFQTYEEYLNSPKWANFRDRYKKSGLFKCVVCGNPRCELHHRTYVRVGNEDLGDVVPLCRDHHEAVHAWLKKNKKSVEYTNEAIAALKRSKRPEDIKLPKVERKKRKQLDSVVQSRANKQKGFNEAYKEAEMLAVQLTSNQRCVLARCKSTRAVLGFIKTAKSMIASIQRKRENRLANEKKQANNKKRAVQHIEQRVLQIKQRNTIEKHPQMSLLKPLAGVNTTALLKKLIVRNRKLSGEPIAIPEAVILTREMVVAGMSSAGGWTRHQLWLIGVEWPPANGWLDVIAQREPLMEKAKYEEFLKLKNCEQKV